MTVHPLPERPNLDQLRRHAKELRTAARHGEAEALARIGVPPRRDVGESGCSAVGGGPRARLPSWPQLRAAVEERLMTRDQKVRAFVRASVTPHTDRAVRLLTADPSLVTNDIWTATVLGDAARVSKLLARDPSLAVLADAESGWTPLLVACNSRWHQIEPARQPGLVEVAETLLDAGADPNTSVGAVPEFGHCSALYAAAGLANHPSSLKCC